MGLSRRVETELFVVADPLPGIKGFVLNIRARLELQYLTGVWVQSGALLSTRKSLSWFKSRSYI